MDKIETIRELRTLVGDLESTYSTIEGYNLKKLYDRRTKQVEALKQALAELETEKPAVKLEYNMYDIEAIVHDIKHCNIADSTCVKVIKSYAESYHSTKCAECKKKGE